MKIILPKWNRNSLIWFSIRIFVLRYAADRNWNFHNPIYYAGVEAVWDPACLGCRGPTAATLRVSLGISSIITVIEPESAPQASCMLHL